MKRGSEGKRKGGELVDPSVSAVLTVRVVITTIKSKDESDRSRSCVCCSLLLLSNPIKLEEIKGTSKYLQVTSQDKGFRRATNCSDMCTGRSINGPIQAFNAAGLRVGFKVD
jgi:hypothetical protein